MPTPGNPTVQVTNRPPDLSLSTPGPFCPAHISDNPPHDLPSKTPAPSVADSCAPVPPPQMQSGRLLRLLVLLDCIAEMRVLTVKERLLLMDIEEPSSDLKWIDFLDEFLDMEKHDIVEVNSLHCSLLSKIGWMGTDNARRVHAYCNKLINSLFSPDKVVFSQNGSITATKD